MLHDHECGCGHVGHLKTGKKEKNPYTNKKFETLKISKNFQTFMVKKRGVYPKKEKNSFQKTLANSGCGFGGPGKQPSRQTSSK